MTELLTQNIYHMAELRTQNILVPRKFVKTENHPPIKIQSLELVGRLSITLMVRCVPLMMRIIFMVRLLITFMVTLVRCGDKFVGETARTLDKCIQVVEVKAKVKAIIICKQLN